MFVENAAFMKSSQELLVESMGHDLEEFNTMLKQLKAAEKHRRPQNT